MCMLTEKAVKMVENAVYALFFNFQVVINTDNSPSL